MSWKEAMKEIGPANLLFLSTDGASCAFMVVGDPVGIETTYAKKQQTRVACPVVTVEGFNLFICGKRVARKLASLEDKFSNHVITVTRHGAEGDTDTAYEVTATPDSDRVKDLKKIAAKIDIPAALAEALEDAKDVTNR